MCHRSGALPVVCLPCTHILTLRSFGRSWLCHSRDCSRCLLPLLCVHPQLSAGGSREHIHCKTEGLSSQCSCASFSGVLNLQALMSHCTHLVAVTSLLSLVRTSLSRSTLLPTVVLRDSPTLGCLLSGLLVLADQAAPTSFWSGEVTPVLGNSRSPA